VFRGNDDVDACRSAAVRAPTFLLGGRMEMTWGCFALEISDKSGHTSGKRNLASIEKRGLFREAA
jgi:hypothetical protein